MITRIGRNLRLMPSDAATLSEDGWERRFWGLLVILSILRVSYVWCEPFELVPDEAYYWDWSRQLDWGYYSKPPLIAWLIAASTGVLGASEFAVRLPAALMGTAGLIPVFWLTRHLFSSEAGFWAVVAAAATPGLTALATLMTIDAPFLCAWAFAMWAVWRLFGGTRPNLRWLFPAIIATGLGLLAKQTMIGLPVLVTAFLLTDRSRRTALISPAYWGWILGSLAFLTPVILWNARHRWVTIVHTQEHFQSDPVPVMQRIVWFLEFWGSQFGLLSPITMLLVLVVSIAAIWSWRTNSAAVRYLVWLGPLPMLLVTALSFQQRVQPNWPAALHLSSLILLAGAVTAVRRGDQPIGFPIAPQWFLRGVALGAFLSISIYGLPLLVPQTALAGTAIDPTTRLRGWKELAKQLQQVQQAQALPSESLVICATSRGPVSEFAYYLDDQPRVYRWNVGEVIDSQHDLWDGPQNRMSLHDRQAWIVTHADHPVPWKLANRFQRLEHAGRIKTRLGHNRELAFEIWQGKGSSVEPQQEITRLPDRAPPVGF